MRYSKYGDCLLPVHKETSYILAASLSLMIGAWHTRSFYMHDTSDHCHLFMLFELLHRWAMAMRHSSHDVLVVFFTKFLFCNGASLLRLFQKGRGGGGRLGWRRVRVAQSPAGRSACPKLRVVATLAPRWAVTLYEFNSLAVHSPNKPAPFPKKKKRSGIRIFGYSTLKHLQVLVPGYLSTWVTSQIPLNNKIKYMYM